MKLSKRSIICFTIAMVCFAIAVVMIIPMSNCENTSLIGIWTSLFLTSFIVGMIFWLISLKD